MRKGVRRSVRYLIRNVFTLEAVMSVLESKADLVDFISDHYPKEDVERWIDELGLPGKLRSATLMTKLEALPSKDTYDKEKPRNIVVEGPLRQLRSAVIISVIEHITFSCYEHNSIKHADKAVATQGVFQWLAEAGGAVIENDMTAFEASVRIGIQRDIELPIIRHIARLLDGVVHRDNPLAAAQGVEERHATHVKWRVEQKERPAEGLFYECVTFLVPTCRSSGDRGTSILNWIVNAVITAAASMGPRAPQWWRENNLKWGPWRKAGAMTWDITSGPKLRDRHVFEGDDTILATLRALGVHGATWLRVFESRLRQAGFMPKLKVVTGGRAEFVGCHYYPALGFPYVGPDVVRTMRSAEIVKSTVALQAHIAGDDRTANSIEYLGLMSRAISLAPAAAGEAMYLAALARGLSHRAGVDAAALATSSKAFRKSRDYRELVYKHTDLTVESLEAALMTGLYTGLSIPAQRAYDEYMLAEGCVPWHFAGCDQLDPDAPDATGPPYITGPASYATAIYCRQRETPSTS